MQHVAGLLARGHEVTVVPFVPSPDPAQGLDAVRDVVDASAPKPPTPTSQLEWMAMRASAVLRHRGRPVVFALDASIPLPASRGRRLLFAERCASFGGIDVVHAQFGHTLAAAVALRRHGVTRAPVVLSVHGQDVNVNAQADPKGFAALARQCAAVTVGTEVMRDVVTGLGVDVAQTRLWFQGVEVARPSVRPPRSQEFRVLSVSRLVAFKGVDDSLRVIAAARDRIPNLRYTVVGDGPERAALEELARSLHVDDITQFVGARDHADALAMHGRADVFLQMGKLGPDGSKEGQGVGVLEASISGLPVVVTPSGGLREVAVDGETALVVETGDIAAGADALVRIAADTKLGNALGEQGRQFARDRFSLDASTTAIEAIYAEAISGGQSPAPQT